MSSGGDGNQLPRGLIGRTGIPSGKGTRLPSIRGPRDLTLGGVQKKVFTPNIPSRRNKPDSSSTAGSEQAASSSNDSKPKRPHSGDRDSRGRGRGRGRGRVSSNVIQTHSMFEQGLTESLPKPSGGSEYSYSGGVRAGGTSSPKKTVKKERTDEETKEVLEQLLRDDFITGPGIEEDVNLMPVKLPLEIHDDIKPLDTKVKVKEEPMDVDGPVGAETLDEKPEKEASKMNMTRVSHPEPISCSDLFLGQKKYENGVLLHFQLPDILPGLPATTDEEMKKKDKTNSDQEHSKDENNANRSLDQFKEGMIGKLVVRKSGRVQMLLGNTYLDVNMGTPNGFLQDVACVRVAEKGGDISLLGHVEHRLVCIPDFETLLDST